MIQYHHAYNSSKELISANSLAGTDIDDTYTCISCNRQLIARVNGKIQRPHFGHKESIGECSEESYLHKLAKDFFVKTYTECLDSNEPFIIEFIIPRTCTKYEHLIRSDCRLGEATQEYNLTQYYTEVKVETRDGEFIPDVSLHSKTRPGDNVYIEIAVTHFLSKKKASSSKRIIEIPIESEDDLAPIIERRITSHVAAFTGFHPEYTSIPDSECKCAKKRFHAFYVYENSKCRFETKELRSIQEGIHRHKQKLIYHNLVLVGDQEMEDFYIQLERSDLFKEQVYLAKERGVNIKNCFLCKYHGISWSHESGKPIFCKTLRKDCGSNSTATCDRFREL